MDDWWIPVIAGFVGGLLPAIIAWLGMRSTERTAIAERVHALRLQQSEHDLRREQRLVESAAQAYMVSESTIEGLDPYYVKNIHDRGAEYPEINDNRVAKARHDLAIVMVTGWHDRLSAEAKALRQAIDQLFDAHQTLWMDWHVGKNVADDYEVETTKRHSDAIDALERYRAAVGRAVSTDLGEEGS